MTSTTRWWWVTAAPIQTTGVYVGQKDEAPTSVDASIYELLGSILPTPTLTYASPLSRCKAPAASLYELKNAPGEVVSLDGFNEQNFGDWEGMAFGDVQKMIEADRPVSHEDIADLKPTNGESFTELSSRAGLAIDTINYQIADSEPSAPVNVLCVAPISITRAAISKALELEPQQALKIHLQPLSLTILEHHPQMGWLVHTTGWTPWPMVK